MRAKVRHDSIGGESLWASALSIGFFFFAMKSYSYIRLLTDWIVSKLDKVDTISKEGVQNLTVFIAGSVVFAFFGFLSCLIFTHFTFRKYKVSRPNSVFQYSLTTLTIISIYLETLIVHLTLATMFSAGIVLANYGVEIMPITAGWVLSIASIIGYGIAAVVGANCLFEQSDKKLVTVFGIGESIYKFWYESMEYKSEMLDKHTIISSYKTQNQFI